MYFYVIPNNFNDYLTRSICQFTWSLYTLKHKKKTAKLTAFNLINNLEKNYYGSIIGLLAIS